MHRRLVLLAAVGLFAALIAPAAFAGKPTITRTTVDSVFLDSSCGFQVSIHSIGDTIDISSTDAEGVVHSIQTYPGSRLEITRLSTQKMITVNISGPGKFTFNPDGSIVLVGEGPWSWNFDPDTGAAGLFVTNGRFVQSVDASGNATITRNGTKTDLCAQLG